MHLRSSHLLALGVESVSSELMGSGDGSVANYVQNPGAMPLDLYQARAWRQIVTDTPRFPRIWRSPLIRGLSPDVYMCLGIREELVELLRQQPPDGANYEYDRRAVMRAPDGILQTARYHGFGEEILDHFKEVGDVAWYLANTLSLFGQVRLGSAVRLAYPALIHGEQVTAGMTDEAALTLAGQIRRRRSDYNSGERLARIGDSYVSLLGGLVVSSRLGNSGRRLAEAPHMQYRLAVSAGRLAVVLAEVAQLKFGSTFGVVLKTNTEKVDKRIKTGTATVGKGDRREEQGIAR